MDVDKTLGPLLIGTWFNTALYATELLLAYAYYRDYPRDGPVLKAMVGAAVTLDALRVLATYAYIYLYVIAHWGDLDFLTTIAWPISVEGLTACSIAAIVQLFLISRYFRLSENTLVTALLFLLCALAYASSLWTTATGIRYPTLAGIRKALVPTSMWLVSMMLTDVCIAASLIWQLRKMHALLGNTRGTIQIVKRVAAIVIETGAFTSIVAVTSLIFFYIKADESVSLGLTWTMGALYVITMLFNLVTRETFSNDNGEHVHDPQSILDFRTGSASGGIVGIRTYLGVDPAGAREHPDAAARHSDSSSGDQGKELEVIFPKQPEAARVRISEGDMGLPETALRRKQDSSGSHSTLAFASE